MKKLQIALLMLIVSSYNLVALVLKRIIEEVFPFAYFYYIGRKILATIYDIDASSYPEYQKLTDQQLIDRLNDEHSRSNEIDDKTFKFTLSLSISLTIISAGGVGLVKLLPTSNLNQYVSSLFFLSSIYMMAGGLIALGALKTLPKFGYGTVFEISKDTTTIIGSLASQEKINSLRHMRNELSYMSLRNGFLLAMLALVLCLFVISGLCSFDIFSTFYNVNSFI